LDIFGTFGTPVAFGTLRIGSSDKLAKQAAAAEYIGPEPVLGFSTIAVRGIVRQWALNAHNKHWLNTEGCRQMKELVT